MKFKELVKSVDRWTPVFASILNSSVWGLGDHVRLVWLTMLFLKDWDGVVRINITGLSRQALVPIDKVQEALKVLSSPDQFSSSGDHEGRRIREVEGGWEILNHDKYVERLDKCRSDQARKKNALMQRLRRMEAKKDTTYRTKTGGSLRENQFVKDHGDGKEA